MTTLPKLYEKRLEEIINEVAHEEWYLELQDELVKTRNMISSGDGNINQLLFYYDKLCLQIHCKTEEKVYDQAFKDGIDCCRNKF